MGITAGALTVARFRVEGDLPEGWREIYRDRLDEFAFKEAPVELGKEESEGWVQIHNLLDTSFADFNRWLYNDYAVFQLRVDKKRLPGKLFKATVDKECQNWCIERELERCPATIRTEIKERIEADWLARTLPSVAVTECSWSINGRYLVLHTLSESTADRFKKRFFRTFGLRLVLWSPLDFLEDRHLVEEMIGCAPTLIRADVPQLADVAPIAAGAAPVAPGGV